MSKIKKFFKYALFLTVILIVWVAVNCIDDSSYDDQGILSKFKDVPDSENGYELVSYFCEPDYELFDQEGTSERLKAHINGKEWDQAFVNQLLKDQSHLVDAVGQAVKRPSYKSPEFESVESSLPILPLLYVGRIILIKSMEVARQNDFNSAINTVKLGLRFGENVKKDENATLISYMIGLALQKMQLRWVQHLLCSEGLNGDQIVEL